MAKPVYSTGDVPTAAEFNSWLVNVNFAYKPVAESVTNSTTLQNDDHLFLPMEANAIYHMNCALTYSGPAPADIKILFAVPTGAILVGVGHFLPANALGQSDVQVAPYGQNSSEVWGTTGTSVQVGTVEAMVATSATAGNLQLQWAQFQAQPTATTIQAYSFIRLTRMV